MTRTENLKIMQKANPVKLRRSQLPRVTCWPRGHWSSDCRGVPPLPSINHLRNLGSPHAAPLPLK